MCQKVTFLNTASDKIFTPDLSCKDEPRCVYVKKRNCYERLSNRLQASCLKIFLLLLFFLSLFMKIAPLRHSAIILIDIAATVLCKEVKPNLCEDDDDGSGA